MQRPRQDRAAEATPPRSVRELREIEANIVKPHDPGDEAIDTDRHQRGDGDHHADLCCQRPAGDSAERDDDDLGRQHEISADSRTHLGPLVLRRGRRMRTGCHLVQPWMCQLIHALEAEIGATQHQQRRH